MDILHVKLGVRDQAKNLAEKIQILYQHVITQVGNKYTN